jgi:hypothetical protein
VSDLGDPAGARLSAELSTLDAAARRVLGVLAVVGRAPVSVETISELSGVPDARPAVEDLDRRRLIVREPGDRLSVAPAVRGRLKTLLATDDEVDAVMRGLIRRAEDGRLDPGDIDAVDEATRGASETGRWPELLRLAQASESTLAGTHRLDEWTRIVERRLEAARALGDEAAAVHAKEELDRLAVMSAPTRVMTAQTEVAERPPARREGTSWPLIVLVGIALAALGLGLGYLIADQTSETTTITETTPVETQVVTETTTGPATTQSTTVTQTETVTETETVVETQTVTEPAP